MKEKHKYEEGKITALVTDNFFVEFNLVFNYIILLNLILYFIELYSVMCSVYKDFQG